MESPESSASQPLEYRRPEAEPAPIAKSFELDLSLAGNVRSLWLMGVCILAIVSTVIFMLILFRR